MNMLKKINLDILLLIFFSSASALIVSSLTSSIPILREYFSNIENSTTLIPKIIFTSPCLGFAMSCFAVGALIDKVKKYKLFFIIGCLACLLFGMEFPIFQNLNSAKYSRFFLGIGVAILVVCANSYSRISLNTYDRIRFASFSLAGSFIISIFAVIFGYLANFISPIAPFFIYIAYFFALIFLWNSNIQNNINISKEDCEVINIKINLKALMIIYLSAFINAFIFVAIESNVPIMVSEIGFSILEISLINILSTFISGIVAFSFDKIKKSNNRCFNFAIFYFIISILHFSLYFGGKSIYFIYIFTIINAVPKTLTTVHSIRWYIQISSSKNIGKISSLFLTSMFCGCFSFVLFDQYFLSNVPILSKFTITSIVAFIFSMYLYIFSKKEKFYETKRV